MLHPSHPVKGTDGAFDRATACQVDIDGGGGDRLVPHEGLDGEQVGAVLVEVGAEGMAERVAGDALRPAQAALVGVDVPGKEECVDGLVLSGLLREEVPLGPPAGAPIEREDVQGGL